MSFHVWLVICLPGVLRQISPHESPQMGTTPPHIARYLVVDDKFEDNDEEEANP
jgi:hypothetical protein